MSAPQWLIDRMEALKKLPPPTLEQVQQQFAASKKFRRDNAKCHKHKEYDMTQTPSGDCYHCWTAYCDKHQTKEAIGLFYAAMEKFNGLKD